MEKINVATAIFKFLEERGVKHVFTVTGGACLHLTNALTNSTIKPVYMHHEQACAMAAEAYARVTGMPAVVLVTSGPGGTNTLTGLLGSWLDSIPVIYISGQVNRSVLSLPPMRQLGDQEFNIVQMVRGITKYAACCLEPQEIGIHMKLAYRKSLAGRPGPVWIDVPLDVQASEF